MGTVWRARDLALHRDVALKEVRPPDPAMAEHDAEGARTLRARVLREARALARIDHPGVVTIHHIVDAGEGTYPWLVMELVTGGSLQDRLDRGPMTPTEAAVLGRRLLDALSAAHERDIEHRDVKPANVLLRPDGRPVLTDFGIAAIRESTVLTASGSIIGSPDYMAPERIRGRSSGPAADLWSLGMLLYVAVEGHHPLRRENTLATLAAVLSDDVPPPRRAGGLTDVLTRLLVRDPSARPDTEELDRALAAAATGSEPADAKPTAQDGAGAVEEQSRGEEQAVGEGDAGGETAGDGTAGDGPAGDGSAGDGSVTSFRLAPPSSPSASSTPPSPPPPSPASSAHPETAPSVPGRAPVPVPARRGRVARFLGSAAVVVLAVGIPVGAMAWDWRPGEAGDGASSAPPSQQGPAAQRPDASTAPVKTSAPAPKELDLLTPAGIKAAVAAVHAATDGAKVTSFVVYPDYAVAQSMVKGSTKRYDRYIYRGEDVAVRQGPGGTAFPGAIPTDLDAYDWDALPALLKRADKELGIDRPTSRYLVVTPGSTMLGSGPGLSIYLSDTYGAAYINADTKGRVTSTHPRED
ncbi:serine/threonine-protein kinase [Streptomyces sp. Root431]|uniref:serine/threonine-protein kinase n=1 Tax=Streptomyces sp. Root431 TaxID=1736535 RepID=UPI001F5BED19|nr:serine/threonine-protein kinase [Streptomyces sp. Root431]